MTHEIDKLKNIVFSAELWLFFVIMFGLWLFLWGAWGGNITWSTVESNEAGLGLNPPPL